MGNVSWLQVRDIVWNQVSAWYRYKIKRHSPRRRMGFMIPKLTMLVDMGHYFTLLGLARLGADIVNIRRYGLSFRTYRCERWFWSHTAVEVFVTVFFVVEIVLIALFLYDASIASCTQILWFARIVLILRLFSIFQAWFQVLIIGQGDVSSAPRLLVLCLINYIEVLLIFSVLSFLIPHAFEPPLVEMWDSLLHTAAVVIPLISIPHLPVNPGWGYVIRSAEILFAMLFLVVVIQRAVASFRR